MAWKDAIFQLADDVGGLKTDMRTVKLDVAAIKAKAEADSALLSGRSFQIKLLAASVVSSAAVSLFIAWAK